MISLLVRRRSQQNLGFTRRSMLILVLGVAHGIANVSLSDYGSDTKDHFYVGT